MSNNNVIEVDFTPKPTAPVEADQAGERDWRLTRRGKIIAGLTSAVLLSTLTANSLANDRDPEGTQIVRIAPGDTLDGLIKEHVDDMPGDMIGEIRHDAVEQNPHVFEDGSSSLGGDDLGKELELPEKVSQ